MFLNPLALDAELELWQKYWETYKGSRPDRAASTHKALNFDGFENIKIALRIVGTLPVTSCECERSISDLRMLKIYNRSTMVEDRLTSCKFIRKLNCRFWDNKEALQTSRLFSRCVSLHDEVD